MSAQPLVLEQALTALKALSPAEVQSIVAAPEFIPSETASGASDWEAEAAAQLAADWTPRSSRQFELKSLKPMHQQVASLYAQGMKNIDIAAIVGITPEYVHVLINQPLVKAYIAEMCDVVGTRMEALFAKSVDVIAETLDKGSESGKLKAVRLQLEATKRIGRSDGIVGLDRGNTDRLEKLAERLIQLQSGVRQGGVFNEDGSEVAEG